MNHTKGSGISNEMEKIEGVITELAASQLYDSQVYTDNDPKSVS